MNKKGIAFIAIVLIAAAVVVIGYSIYSNYKTSPIETETSSDGTSTSGTSTTGGSTGGASTTGTSSGGSGGTSTTGGSTGGTSTTGTTTGGTSSGGTSTTGGSGGSSGSSNSTFPPAGSSGPAAVNLGTAGDFAILSKAGVSTTGTTSVTGDIGVSPIDSTAITGFGLILDSSECFSTSSLVTGKVYAADYDTLGCQTPAKMTTAVSDMETAYADAAGRTNPTATELGAGNVGGMTLTPGLYKWGTGLTIPTDVTLNCRDNSNAVFIFQIAQDLEISSGKQVILSSGCQAKNIFWQVAGQATLGTTSNFKGNILSATLIEMNTGATLNGRALAQTAVTLDANAVTISN